MGLGNGFCIELGVGVLPVIELGKDCQVFKEVEGYFVRSILEVLSW